MEKGGAPVVDEAPRSLEKFLEVEARRLELLDEGLQQVVGVRRGEVEADQLHQVALGPENALAEAGELRSI